MPLSTRYGIIGLAALALLSLVHWVRDKNLNLDLLGIYLIGVGPNFAAAIAINFVLLSVWSDKKRDAGFQAARYRFFVCAAISGVGLFGWEFVQKTNQKFVFDIHDMLATLGGIGLGVILFYKFTPRNAESGRQDRRGEAQ